MWDTVPFYAQLLIIIIIIILIIIISFSIMYWLVKQWTALGINLQSK
jgi:hypothetical protein